MVNAVRTSSADSIRMGASFRWVKRLDFSMAAANDKKMLAAAAAKRAFSC
jgi:hypothetical protein